MELFSFQVAIGRGEVDPIFNMTQTKTHCCWIGYFVSTDMASAINDGVKAIHEQIRDLEQRAEWFRKNDSAGARRALWAVPLPSGGILSPGGDVDDGGS
jgi:hypothetical protein